MLKNIFRATVLVLLAAVAVLVYVNYFRAPAEEIDLGFEHPTVEAPPQLPNLPPNPEPQTAVVTTPVAPTAAEQAPAASTPRPTASTQAPVADSGPIAEYVEIPSSRPHLTVTHNNLPIQAQPRTHVVKPGESLWVISKKYYGNAELLTKIAESNNLTSRDRIRAGQVLVIPDLNAAPAVAASTKPAHVSEDEADHEDGPRALPVSLKPVQMSSQVRRY